MEVSCFFNDLSEHNVFFASRPIQQAKYDYLAGALHAHGVWEQVEQLYCTPDFPQGN